jgi:hypothetical protein
MVDPLNPERNIVMLGSADSCTLEAVVCRAMPTSDPTRGVAGDANREADIGAMAS